MLQLIQNVKRAQSLKSIGAKLGAATVVALSTVPAFAALDITEATTAVGDAKTAMLAVLALLVGLAAGVWALRKIVGLFGK